MKKLDKFQIANLVEKVLWEVVQEEYEDFMTDEIIPTKGYKAVLAEIGIHTRKDAEKVTRAIIADVGGDYSRNSHIVTNHGWEIYDYCEVLLGAFKKDFPETA